MARMHARRKGKSSSKHPLIQDNPKWVPLGTDEIVEIIVKKSGEGLSSAEIGLLLRDQHGVPDVKLATKKSITQIMKENGIELKLPEDLSNLIRRAVNLNTFLKDHPKDLHNRRSLHLMEAKIRRLERYYKDNGVLPKDWKYALDTAELELSR